MEVLTQGRLSRSKSTGFLDKLENQCDFKCFSRRFCGYRGCDNQHASVSSLDDCSEHNGSDVSIEETKLDSGIGKSLLADETLQVLEQKVDKLSDLLQEQHTLLKSIKQELLNSKIQDNRQHNANKLSEKVDGQKETKPTNDTMKIEETCLGETGQGDGNVKEMICDASLDQMIKTALEQFLRSDGLKEHLAAVTVECMKGVVRGRFRKVVSDAYLPMVERSHRRLIKHVTKLLEDSFMDLEHGSASLLKSVQRSSKTMRLALERHQRLLEASNPVKNISVLRASLKEVLEEELKAWRGKLMEEMIQSKAFTDNNGYENECSSESSYADYAISPHQPANPDTSIIDSLMKCAVINKHIQDGSINEAFEEALSSSDLSLVMAACRAASPAQVFAARCRLRQPVLLSLLQQLATDMVHDTQLKCRYLEDTIISLDKCDSATRMHLPLVVSEVRKHLTKFLLAYPKHYASRRIALILMAADNLLK